MADPLARALVDYTGPTLDQKMAEIMPSKPNPTGWETDHGAVEQYNIMQGLLTDMSFQEQLDSKTKMVDLFQKMLPNMERSQVVENLPMLYQSITGQQHVDSVNPLERMGQVLDNTWKSGSAEFSYWMQEKTDNMVKGFQGLEQVAGQGAIGGQTGSRLISQLGMENTSAQAATKTKVDALKGYVEKTSVDHGGQWWLPIVDNTAMFVGSMAQMLPEGVAGGLVAGPVGAAIGAWDASARLQAASSYKTMRDRGVSFELSDTAATTIGQAAAVLDVFEIGASARLVLKPLLHAALNQTSRTLAQKLLNYGGEYALTVGAGTAEEVAQEAISIAGENYAYQAQNKYQTRGQTTFEKQIKAAQLTGDTLQGYLSSAIKTHNEQSLIPLDTPDEIAKRLADTAVSAAIGMAVLGGAGLGSVITARAVRNAWDKHQNKKDFARLIENIGTTVQAAAAVENATPAEAPAEGITVYFAGHSDSLATMANGLELHSDPATAEARGRSATSAPVDAKAFLAEIARLHPAVLNMVNDVLAKGPEAAQPHLAEEGPVIHWENTSDGQFHAQDIIQLADQVRTGEAMADRNTLLAHYGLEAAIPAGKITEGVINPADVVDVASDKEIDKAFKAGAKAVRVGDRLFIRDASVMTVTAQRESAASVAEHNPSGDLSFTANGNTIIARKADGTEVGRLTHEPTALGSRITDVQVPEQFRRQGVATKLIGYHRGNNVGKQVDISTMTPEGITLRDKVRWANAPRFMAGLRRAEAAGNQQAVAFYWAKVDKVAAAGQEGTLSNDDIRAVLMSGTTMDAEEIDHVASVLERMAQAAGVHRDDFLATAVETVTGIVDGVGQLRETANGVAMVRDAYIGLKAGGADVTTILHEAFHHLRPLLGKADQDTLLTWTGETQWTAKAEELAARGFEKHIMEGPHIGGPLDAILDKLSGWFKIIYDEIVGVSTLVASVNKDKYAVDLNDAARAVYSKVLQGEASVETPLFSQDYRGEHSAPDRYSGSPMHDVLQNKTYPSDFYGPMGHRYYGIGDGSDFNAYQKILAAKGNPEADITVWRAVPKDAPNELNPGDWVTIDRQYAVDHGDSALNGNWKMVRRTVKAKDLYTDGNSIQEWGWSPSDGALLQDVWHGSPYEFDAFDHSKMGTGEGAQAFGWGTYLAGSKDLAEHYREKLSPGARIIEIGRNQFEVRDPDGNLIAGPKQDGTFLKSEAHAAKDEWDKTKGQLYKVSIPDDTGLLDYDQLLADNPDQIKPAIDKVHALLIEGELPKFEAVAETVIKSLGEDDPISKGIRDSIDYFKANQWDITGFIEMLSRQSLGLYRIGTEEADKLGIQLGESLFTLDRAARIKTGRDLYESLSRKLGSDKTASLFLSSLGISGHRFLDGNSRSKGEGSYNYVIYDETQAQIVDKLYSEDVAMELDARYNELHEPVNQGELDFTEGLPNDGTVGRGSDGRSEPPKDFWAYKNLKAGKTVDIIGKQIRDFRVNGRGLPGDVAEALYEILSIYRDRRYETFRCVFVAPDGTIVDHIAITARHPTAAYIAPSGANPELHFEMLRKMAENTGSQIVLVHNHPSGKVEASMQDISVTKRIAEVFGDTLAGHIILDHGKFSNIWTSKHIQGVDPVVSSIVELTTDKKGKDPTVKNKIPGWVGRAANPNTDATALIDLAKFADSDENHIAVAMANGQGKLTALHYLPRSIFQADLKTLQDHLLKVQRNVGALWAFPIVTSFEDVATARMWHSEGVFMDFVNARDPNHIWVHNSAGGTVLNIIDSKKETVFVKEPLFSQDAPASQIDAVRARYEGTPQWLKAPNGADTNLTERQWLQVRTVAFKRWFGDWEKRPTSATSVVAAIEAFRGSNDSYEYWMEANCDLFAIKLGKGLKAEGAGEVTYWGLGNEKGRGWHVMVSWKDDGETLYADYTGVYSQPNTIDYNVPQGDVLDWQKIDLEHLGERGQPIPVGASKVVDENGEPMVVYHGSSSNHDVFETGRVGGIYFSRDRGYASSYGEMVYESFLDIRAVADLTDSRSDAFNKMVEQFNSVGGWKASDDAWAYLQDSTGRTDPLFDPKLDSQTWEIFDSPETGVRDNIIANGYDGVYLQERWNDGDPIDSIAVFSPTQIKSATANSGAFDPSNPSILYSEDQVNSPSFKRWFNDSKAVDSNGKPKVFYHGTDSQTPFSAFDPQYRELGFHFGTVEQANARVSEAYDGYTPSRAAEVFSKSWDGNPDSSGMRVMPVYLSIQTPYDIVSDLGNWEDVEMLREYLGPGNEGPFSLAEVDAMDTPDDFRVGLQRLGYDGIVYENAFEGGGQSYIAFEPTQIKSSVGNNGSYDPANPSILFSEDAGFLGKANEMAMAKRYKGQRDFKVDIQRDVLAQQKKDGYRFILTDIEKDIREVSSATKKALDDQERATKAVERLTESIPKKEAELEAATKKNDANNSELAARGKDTKAESAVMRDARIWLEKYRPQLSPALAEKKAADAEVARLSDKSAALSSEYDKSFNRLVELGFADSIEAMKTNALAIGWYDLKIRHALAALALIHPEIATDKAKKGAFLWALAVTSNGLKVRDNFPLAEKAYNRYMATGKMPGDIGIGTAANAINDSLLKYNDLVEEFGAEELADLMLLELKASQVTKLFKTKVTGEAADETVLGAAVIGPKIGNGFYANLNGIFNQLTMDRWFIRTWGRWTGTLVTERPEMVAAGKAQMAKLIEELSGDAAAREELKKLKISLDMAEAKSFMEADLKQLQDDLKAFTDKTSETHQKIEKMATDAYRKGQLTRFEKLGDGIPAKQEKVDAAQAALNAFKGDESTEAGAKEKKSLVKALTKAQADIDSIQSRIREGFDADQAAKVQEQVLYIERRLSSIPLEIASIESAMDMVQNEPEAYLATMVHKASIDSETRSQLNNVRLASETNVVNEESSDEEDTSDAPLAGTIGNRLRLAGNGLWKYLDGQKEAPGGPVERQVVRRVAREVLNRLHAKNLNLTMADFQALLWYAEKNLYETLGMEPGKAAVYNEADAPDYANAARLLASNTGKTDAEIQEAIDAADRRVQVLSSDGRPADAGSGDQSQLGSQDGQGTGRGQGFGERATRLREKYGLFSEDSLDADVLSQQLDAARIELASLEDPTTLDKRIDAQARQSSAPREAIAREFRKRAESLRVAIAVDEQALATLRAAATSRPTRDDVQKLAVKAAVDAGKIVPTSTLNQYATEAWAAAELERRESLKDLIAESLKYDDIDAWLEAARDEAAMANPDFDVFNDTAPELTPEDRATYKAAYLAARMKDAAEFDKDFLSGLDEAKARDILAKLGTNEPAMQAHKMPRFVKAVALKLANDKEVDPKELARSITAMKNNPRPYRHQVWQYAEGGQVDELLIEALAVEQAMEAAALDYAPPAVEVKALELDPDTDFKLAAELRMSNESKNYWQQRSVQQDEKERALKKEVAGLEKVVETKLEKIDQQKDKTSGAKREARKLEGRLDTATGKVADLKDENKALKNFSSRLWVALEIKKNQVVSLEETRAEFEDALNSARQEADATAAGYKDDIAALEKFSSRLWKALEKTKADARNANEWLDLYKQSYHDAVAQTKIELDEQRKAIRAAEKEARAIRAKFQQMRDMAAYIARPVPKTIHVDEAQQIERMRAMIDPHFRKDEKVSLKRAEQFWYSQHPEEYAHLNTKAKRELNTKSLNLWSFEELENEYLLRKHLEANGRFKLNYKMEQRKARIDRIKREILGAVYKDWAAFDEKVKAMESDLTGMTDEAQKEELRLKISTAMRQRDQIMVNAGQADDKRGKGGDLQALIFTLSNMADILDGGKDYKGPNFEMLYKVPNKAENEFLTEKLRRTDAMFAWLKDNKVPVRDLFKRIKVDGTDSVWTVDALIDIYVGMKNEKKSIAIVHGNKVDPEVIRFAQESPDLAWARNLGDKILAEYEENQQRLFDAIAENENAVPGYEPNYSPMARAEIDLEAMDDQIKYEMGMATAVRAASVEKGFSISRLEIPAEYQKPIKLGAWTQWLEQVVRQEQYISYAPVVKDLKSIYHASEVKNAIEQARGSGYWHEIDTYINTLANRYWGKSFTAFDRVMGRLQSNSAIAYMSYNMATMLKQIPSLFTFMGHTRPDLLVWNLLKLPHTIKMADKRSVQQKGRVERFGFIAIDQGKRKTAVGRWVYEFSHVGMMPMQLVDKAITAAGWGAAFDTAKAKGQSDQDAIDYADFVVDQTQQAGHPKAVAGAYRNQNALLRTLLMFTGPSNKIFNQIGYGNWQALSKGRYLKSVGITIGIAASMAVFWSIGKGQPPETEEDWLQALGAGMVELLPIIGPSLAALIRGYGQGVSPAQNVVQNVADTVKYVTKAVDAKDEEVATKNAIKAAQAALEAAGLTFQFPVTAPIRVFRAVGNGNAGEILGWRAKD